MPGAKIYLDFVFSSILVVCAHLIVPLCFAYWIPLRGKTWGKPGQMLQNTICIWIVPSFAGFPHNIYVLGLLFFVPANATAEEYENGFPQGPLPPERIEVIAVPLLSSFYTEMQILIPAQPDLT